MVPTRTPVIVPKRLTGFLLTDTCKDSSSYSTLSLARSGLSSGVVISASPSSIGPYRHVVNLAQLSSPSSTLPPSSAAFRSPRKSRPHRSLSKTSLERVGTRAIIYPIRSQPSPSVRLLPDHPTWQRSESGSGLGSKELLNSLTMPVSRHRSHHIHRPSWGPLRSCQSNSSPPMRSSGMGGIGSGRT